MLKLPTTVIKDQGSMVLTKGETDQGDGVQKPEINPPTHPKMSIGFS